MDEDNIGYDSYSVNVKLRKHIPDTLPIRGKRVKLTYPGIPAFCNQCWRIGHTHWDCQRGKSNWLEFVEDFYNNREVTDDMLGTWVDAVKKYLPSQGGARKQKTNQNKSQVAKEPKVKSKVVVPANNGASPRLRNPPASQRNQRKPQKANKRNEEDNMNKNKNKKERHRGNN